MIKKENLPNVQNMYKQQTFQPARPWRIKNLGQRGSTYDAYTTPTPPPPPPQKPSASKHGDGAAALLPPPPTSPPCLSLAPSVANRSLSTKKRSISREEVIMHICAHICVHTYICMCEGVCVKQMVIDFISLPL